MNYVTTLSLYSFLFSLGYFVSLIRRSKFIQNGVTLQHHFPALRPLYAQVVLSVLLKPRQLPSANSVKEPTLPELCIVSKGVSLDRSKLDKYCDMCQLPRSREIPLVYPSIETFCMNLACMCMSAFPISVLGGVLARYKVTMHQSIADTEVLTYRQHLHSTMRRTGKNDLEFDMSVSAYNSQDELVWQDTSTFLSFGKQRQASSKASNEPSAAAGSWPHAATWQLGTNAGPRFAALNGDINLIHLSPVLARLFGFPSNIAHGVFLLSKSIAAMQQAGAPQTYPQVVSASFLRPAVLPGQYCCRWQHDMNQPIASSSDFVVQRMASGKAVISGQYSCGQTALAKI